MMLAQQAGAFLDRCRRKRDHHDAAADLFNVHAASPPIMRIKHASQFPTPGCVSPIGPEVNLIHPAPALLIHVKRAYRARGVMASGIGHRQRQAPIVAVADAW
jgi:hypothetical protein